MARECRKGEEWAGEEKELVVMAGEGHLVSFGHLAFSSLCVRPAGLGDKAAKTRLPGEVEERVACPELWL